MKKEMQLNGNAKKKKKKKKLKRKKKQRKQSAQEKNEEGSQRGWQTKDDQAREREAVSLQDSE